MEASMEFRDLKKQYKMNQAAIDDAIKKVLQNADFINGTAVEELENKLAQYVESKYCITCANGTDALQIALMTWNIRKGDAVFVPDFTFFSTAEVVIALEATPVFVDVEEDTFNISATDLEYKIKEVLETGNLKPKAVIAVDLFGLPADYEKIRSVTDQYQLLLLEDGAQGFGGKIGNKKACSFGDISTTSFFPAKPLGCYGDGGAIFTDHEEWAVIMKSIKAHGKGVNKYDNIRIGMNSRLDTIQAAILMEKLNIFDAFELRKLNKIADEYNKSLKDIVKTPCIPKGYRSSYAQYTILSDSEKERNELKNFLHEHKIPSMIYYSKPLHLQEVFDSLEVNKMKICSTTMNLCKRVLSLPMHPYLEQEEINYITDTIKNYLE